MADIETSCQEAIDAGKINGVILCATDAAGGFTYERALGERTLLSGEKRPQRADDVLFLASATKLIAAVAALQCVEDGLLTLDGDLSSIAPELAAKKVLTGFADDDDDKPILEPAARPITLEMLLTHTAGTTYDFLSPLATRWSKKYHPVPPPGVRRTVEEAFAYPLAYQPGTGWGYGTGLDWAGRVVERVSGLPLGEWAQRRIFEPLGIESAQFFPVTREDLRARMVDLNPADPHGLGHAVLGGNAELNRRSNGHFGGHGLFMSGTDYIKVLHSLLANDGRILRPATVDDMFLDHLSSESSAAQRALIAGPLGPHLSLGTKPGAAVSYGFGGLLTLDDSAGFYGARTLSWGGGLTFTWFIDRQNGLCALCAIQAVLSGVKDPSQVENDMPQTVDYGTSESLKQIFREDISRKHAAWKAKEAQK